MKSNSTQRYLLAATALASAIVLMAALLAEPAQAQIYEVLHTFGGADGAYPTYVVLDKAGNLYGTTIEGGSSGAGTVYKIDASGMETVLYSFTGGADGLHPEGPLVLAGKYIYGTTVAGGTGFGYGVVYKVNTKTGVETVLYSFTGSADGGLPYGGVIRDSASNLYGTTSSFGADGYGVVFKVSPSGAETVLHTFTGTDGAGSDSALFLDKSGNLYGTTFGGGAYGAGTVFKVAPSGMETLLHSFTGGGDGAYPTAGLVRGKGGNLYGATPIGGSGGLGVVYKLSATGTETVLYSFPGGGLSGGEPVANLLFAGTSLYGTTAYDGEFGYGTVFKLDSMGAESVLYNFADSTDGGYPIGNVVLDTAGNLYGTANNGGSTSACSVGCGVVFKIIP